MTGIRRAYPLGLHRLLDRVGTRFARRHRPRPLTAVHRPAGVTELLAAASGPRTVIAGGGMDVMVQPRQGLLAPAELVRTTTVPELTEVTRTGRGLTVGAAVT